MTSAQGIGFEVRPSAQLGRVLAAVVGLATLAPLFTSLPAPVRWCLAAAIGVFGVGRIRRLHRPVLRRVVWLGDGVWRVTRRCGTVSTAALVGSRRVGPALFVSLRWTGGAGHLVLLPDNTPTDDLRRLRAVLGRGGPGGTGG